MADAKKVKWSLEADYLQACNCDYGCPCEFEAPPTMGFCQGLGVYRINKGNYGDVRLDGLGMAWVVSFPKAMHQGNGTGGYIIDERANPQQREALNMILSGKAGGMPFELFPQLLTKMMDPQFAAITIDLKGRNSSAKVGQAMGLAV